MSEEIKIYTDGGARPMGGNFCTGSGVYAEIDSKNCIEIAFSGGVGRTNNTAELEAFIRACKLVIEKEFKRVLFLIDSKYVILSAQKYLAKWKSNGWVKSDGEMVRNKELWLEADEWITKLKDANVTYNLMWVKGHSDNKGNEKADDLATKGVVLCSKGADEEYYYEGPINKKPTKVVVNGLLAFKRWLFQINHPVEHETIYRLYGERHPYFICEFEDKDEMAMKYLAKPSSTAAYGLLALKEELPYLDMIKEAQDDPAITEDNMPVMGLLDTIKNKNILTELIANGKSSLTKAGGRISLWGSKYLTHLLSPALLSSYAIKRQIKMEQRLLDFMGDAKYFDSMTEVTGYFFSEDKKGFKLKDGITSQTKYLDIIHKGADKDLKTRVTLGIDLPTRNDMNRLSKTYKEAKVFIAVYEQNPNTYKFSLFFVCDDDYALFEAANSNLRMIGK